MPLTTYRICQPAKCRGQRCELYRAECEDAIASLTKLICDQAGPSDAKRTGHLARPQRSRRPGTNPSGTWSRLSPMWQKCRSQHCAPPCGMQGATQQARVMQNAPAISHAHNEAGGVPTRRAPGPGSRRSGRSAAALRPSPCRMRGATQQAEGCKTHRSSRTPTTKQAAYQPVGHLVPALAASSSESSGRSRPFGHRLVARRPPADNAIVKSQSTGWNTYDRQNSVRAGPGGVAQEGQECEIGPACRQSADPGSDLPRLYGLVASLRRRGPGWRFPLFRGLLIPLAGMAWSRRSHPVHRTAAHTVLARHTCSGRHY